MLNLKILSLAGKRTARLLFAGGYDSYVSCVYCVCHVRSCVHCVGWKRRFAGVVEVRSVPGAFDALPRVNGMLCTRCSVYLGC